MSNTINVNGMTSYYSSFIKSVTSQTLVDKGSNISNGAVTGEKDSFISTLSSKVETASTIEGTTTVSTKDMTLEEYKNYIHDKISSIPMDPSQAIGSISIHITDAGFEAMKNDPEYEKWVMDGLKTNFQTHDPWSSMCKSYSVFHIGASKEECSASGWYEGYKGGKGGSIWEDENKGSFWTKRAEQKKIQDRIDKKAAEKKELEEKWLQEAAEKRRAYTDFLNGDKVLKTNNISELNDFFRMPSDPKVAGILSAYEAGTFAGGGLI
jgi:hypothetical protein